MRVEFEGSIHEFPDDFTDKEIGAALASLKPTTAKSARTTGFLDRIKTAIGEGANVLNAESEIAVGGQSMRPLAELGAGAVAGLASIPAMIAGGLGYVPDVVAGGPKYAGKQFEERVSTPTQAILGDPKTNPSAYQSMETLWSPVTEPLKMAGEGWGMIADAYGNLVKGQLEKERGNLTPEQYAMNTALVDVLHPIAATIGEASALFAIPGLKGLPGRIRKAVTESTPFRQMTIPERGLVVQSLDDMIARGYSEAEVLRQWNSPQWRSEALARRSQGEAPKKSVADELPPQETGFTMSNPIVAEALVRAARERLLPGPEGLDMGNVPDFTMTPNRGIAEMIVEANRKALPGAEMPLALPEPDAVPYSPELAALVRQVNAPALPPGQGFTMPEVPPETVLRKAPPSWTEGRLPESVEVDYKPRLSKSGAPFKTYATAQKAKERLGLSDNFIVVPVEGGFGVKRVGAKASVRDEGPQDVDAEVRKMVVSDMITGLREGEAGLRLDDSEGLVDVIGRFTSNPDWYGDFQKDFKAKTGLSVGKNEIINALKKDLAKDSVSGKQERILRAIEPIIRNIEGSDYYQKNREGLAAAGKEPNQAIDVPAGELSAPGTKVLKDGEVFTSKGFDADGNVVLKDGTTLRVDPFEQVSIDRILSVGKEDSGPTFYSGLDPVAAVKAIRGLGNDIQKAIPRLEALGRSVYESGKKTAKEWVASMKSLLGDLWAKFRDKLRDIWNNLKAMDRSKGPMGSERGSLKKEKGNATIPPMSKDKGTGNIPPETTPKPVGGIKVLEKSADHYQKNPQDLVDSLVDLIGDESGQTIGLRGIYQNEIGKKKLSPSYEDYGLTSDPREWNEAKAKYRGDKFRKLKGTSAINIAGDWDYDHASIIKDNIRKNIDKALSYGDAEYLAIVKGKLEKNEIFNDKAEVVLSNAKVIGYIKKSDLPNPSRPPEVGGRKGPAGSEGGPILYSGIDITKIPEVLKHIRDNLKEYKAVLPSKDVTLLQRIWHNPQWLAKKHPEFQRFFDREQAREKGRAKLFDARLKGWESARNLSPKDMKKLQKVIWITEGRKFKSVTEPRFYWEDNTFGATGQNGKPLQVVKGLNLKHYRQIGEYLKQRGVSDNVITAYVDIRKNFDKSYATILNKMVSMKEVEPDVIEKYRQEIGNISNYFPHQWYGNYSFHGLDKDGNVLVRIQYNDVAPGGYSAVYGRKLKKAKEEYPQVAEWTKASKTRQMPEEIYEYPIPVEAMQQILDAAVSRVKDADPAAADIFKNAMPEAVSDVMKSRGFGSRMIRRKGVMGYEKEDILRVLYDFDSSFSGWMTKMDAAKDFSAMLAEMSARKNPGLYSYTSRFVKDVLSNTDRVDRIVDGLRALIFIKYLGLNLKTGAVNLTQPLVNGMPRLSIDSGWRALEWTKAAATDIAGAATKGKALRPDEARLLDELYREGVTQAQYANEVKGRIGGAGSGVLNAVNNAAGWFMSVTERFNRGSLALAAYRLARDGHIKNKKTLEKYGLTKGQKADYEIAKKYAEEVNADANFTYGKGNIPEWMRGRTKLLRAGYSLASFAHNEIQMWAWMLRQGGPGIRALAASMLSLAVFGGVKSLPFFKPLMEAWRKAFGTDPQEEIRKRLPGALKDVVIYGAPSALGVNIGGSMEIGNIDSSNPLKWIVGVPWSLAEEPIRAKEFYQSGQTGRAVEEVMPTVIKNPMAAKRLYSEGQFSKTGQPINLPGEEGPRKITMIEAVGKSFGFQPVSSTKASDARRALDDLKEFVQKRQAKWANRYVNAYNADDLKEMAKIRDEVDSWNERWMKQDRPEFTVNLKDAIRNRVKPRDLPKKFRGLGLKYAEDYI